MHEPKPFISISSTRVLHVWESEREKEREREGESKNEEEKKLPKDKVLPLKKGKKERKKVPQWHIKVNTKGAGVGTRKRLWKWSNDEK